MNIRLNSENYIKIIKKDDKKRPLLLILPGGGYMMTSEREALPVVEIFKSESFHQAIFYYRETQLYYPEILEEGHAFLKVLKALDFVSKLYIMGFSAGGHYAMMLSKAYPHLIEKTLLLYPVITSDKPYLHEGSFENLLGDHPDASLLEKVSLEKHIDQKLPPVFIMHTIDDLSVPVENSLRLIDALKKSHNYVEAHLYPTGRHGVSIATKDVAFIDMEPKAFIQSFGYLSEWTKLAKDFLRRDMK
ncbi:MAG: acetylesterase [Tenericutes bacterium HGW-Tenericutes-6]|jgi:dipeptidyl aminopeptidase/acylaminoacyl peptidase|nr:MAG: acetylesterase [Tenericutes bacterium HGW-Tenericutes-6]